jgi:hypothetical protein
MVSLSAHEMCTQNFQVLKLGKLSYCFMALSWKQICWLEFEIDLYNVAEDKIILKCTLTIVFSSLNYMIH